MFRKKLMSRTLLGGMLSMTLVGQPLLSQRAFADGGDFSLDFTAAAPRTYDHTTGGGAYDDRTIGVDKDVVESLEGGDFFCGDKVSFLTQITVDAGAVGSQDIDLTFAWTPASTGQPGVAFNNITSRQINYGAPILDPDGNIIGEGPGGSDLGISDDLGSAAPILIEVLSPLFDKKAPESVGTIRVTDLEAGELVVLRFELVIACSGQKATGNLQARLAAASVVGSGDVISVGDQTINLKNVGDIKCDPKVGCPPPPK
jgi:hypothetical protein